MAQTGCGWYRYATVFLTHNAAAHCVLVTGVWWIPRVVLCNGTGVPARLRAPTLGAALIDPGGYTGMQREPGDLTHLGSA